MHKAKIDLLKFINSPFFPYFALISIICGIYYKFFLLGKIPFPGDLLVVSYSPWFDKYKFPVQNPLISDVFSQFFLWKYLAIDSFKALQWPLWNPYSFSGTPLLATFHSAVLYPLNILLLLPKYSGWGVYIFSQTLLSAITMYLFLSLYLNSKLARLLGAIIFAFGGLMTTWLELGTAGHAIVWLPLCLYLIYKYYKNFKLRYLLLLIFSLSALILAGNAQIATYTFIIIPLYALLESGAKNFKSSLFYILPILTSLFLAILLTSPQLLTSLDIFKKSIRLSDSYTGEFNFGLLNIKDSIRFFIADFFGNPVNRNFWGGLNYSESSGFVGSLTLPLILFSLLYLRKTKIIIFFQILLFVSLLLAFDNPLSQMIYRLRLPLLTSSYASRILFISSFAISILSAFSLNQILIRNEKDKLFKTVIFSLAAFIGTLVGSAIILRMVEGIINSAPSKFYLNFYLKDYDYALSNFVVSIRNTIIPISFICSFLISAFLVTRLKFKSILNIKTFLICLFLFVILTFDLGRYFLKFNPFVPQELVFPKTKTLTYLQNQPGVFRVGREHAEVLPPNTWTAYNLSSFEGYDPIYLEQYAKFIHFLNGGDIRKGTTGRYAEISPSGYSSPFLDTANVKYFIAILRDNNGYIPGDLVNFKFKDAKYNVIFKDRASAILENPNALDRVYFAKNIKIASLDQTGEIFMTDKNFDPRITTALTQNLNINKVTGTGSAIITKYTPNKVVIKTKVKQEEILVLSDQYEEGWKATIDGKNVPISRANMIFRAVKVPAGSYEVIFNYWPASFELGLKIFVTTILLLGLTTLVAYKTKKL